MTKWFLIAILLMGLTAPALAHCDTEDGPVVKAGRHAVSTQRPEFALVWVQPAGEAAVLDAFAMAGTPEGERAFLETLVRVHRDGEGEAYDGVKPAGTEVPAPVAALDRALESGSREGLAPEVREAYDHLAPLRRYDPKDLAAGRRYVAAYVAAIHELEARGDGHDCCEHHE